MKRRFQLGFLILFISLYCLYLNRHSLNMIPGRLNIETQGRYYDYRGATHVHSSISTGSSTPNEIIKVAQNLKLDFLFFTEVNRSSEKTINEGYNGPLLVMEGGEYSYLDSRVLYYNIPSGQPPEAKGQEYVYLSDLLSQTNRPIDQGFFVLAHPLHTRHRWTGDYPAGLDAIEVVNLKRVLEVAWEERKFASIWSVLTYWFNPSLALLRIYKDPEDELQLWDKMNADRKTVGFLGADATAKAILFSNFFIRFPTYETSLGVASNHVLLRSELTGDSMSDRSKILQALRDGEFYIALDILGDPRGFWAELKQKNKAYLPGAQVKWQEGSQLHVHLPIKPSGPFEVRIIRNGELFAVSNTQDTVINLPGPGYYRVVVRLIVNLPFPEGNRWMPWIYTNGFTLN